MGCARAILKNAGIQNYNYVVLTDLGIEKNKDFNLSDEDIVRVKGAIVAACKGPNVGTEAGKFSRIVGCCG